MNNVTLIGMPGCGKSTIGVVLAKVLGYRFVDTDLLIQERESMLLHEIIREKGTEAFARIEEEVNAHVQGNKMVIATGGSVVYGQKAMEHLRSISTVVYIRLPLAELEHRLGNIRRRGVLLREGQTLTDLYEERCPLYEKYAHIAVDAMGMNVEQLMDEIVKRLDS
ncbi:MAG: shikimate kinase [Lachnospiraceae bacterium]|nr:shikimate kinase [Lachnospiraceae bacterium]